MCASQLNAGSSVGGVCGDSKATTTCVFVPESVFNFEERDQVRILQGSYVGPHGVFICCAMRVVSVYIAVEQESQCVCCLRYISLQIK